MLNRHLLSIEYPKAPTGREEDETRKHVLFHCPAVAELCEAILGEHWINIAMVSDAPVSLLTQFILNTDWLAQNKKPAVISSARVYNIGFLF